MNLVIDWGNSSLKLGWFIGPVLVHTQHVATPNKLAALLAGQAIEHVIVSSTSRPANELRRRVDRMGGAGWLALNGTTPVPISKQYDTPHTLGTDRVAAAVGATVLFPGQNCLVIDMGSCITADLVDAELTFRGGLIAPGLHMRLRAMHTFTERLPLVDIGRDWPELTARPWYRRPWQLSGRVVRSSGNTSWSSASVPTTPTPTRNCSTGLTCLP